MKMIHRIAKLFFACCALPLLCAGCGSIVSVVEKGGQALDGTAFAEKKIAVYGADGVTLAEVQNKAGEQSLVITMEQFPAIKFRAAAPDSEGNFHLTALEYLGGSPHGWNEYRLDLSGSGTIAKDAAAAALALRDIEPVEIASGRIRRYDTRIMGTEALVSLRNRQARVSVLAEWMRNNGGNVSADAPRADFEKYWKSILFPETVSKKKRPANWQQAGDALVKAEGIRWNTGYTARIFPEELRAVRDSGTLLRDWEEAAAWIYTEYHWPRITETLAREITLQQRKK